MKKKLKPLGIIRKLDALGRIVIPAEVKKANGWKENQPMEMFAVEGGLFIKAYRLDTERYEILDQLEHLKKSTNNEEVLFIVGNAIEFLKRKGAIE